MTDFVVGQKEICFYVTVECEIPTTQITYLKRWQNNVLFELQNQHALLLVTTKK